MISVQDPIRRKKIKNKKMRIKSAMKRTNKRNHGNWYYKKYQVSKGMNPFQGSQLRNKLYYDHRTHTIPKTTIKNKVIDGLLQREGDVNKDNNLMKGIFDLKKMGLLKNKNVSKNKLAAD